MLRQHLWQYVTRGLVRREPLNRWEETSLHGLLAKV